MRLFLYIVTSILFYHLGAGSHRFTYDIRDSWLKFASDKQRQVARGGITVMGNCCATSANTRLVIRVVKVPIHRPVDCFFRALGYNGQYR